MKKILFAALFAPLMALAQTYPSPTFSSLTLQNPLAQTSGGTGTTAATGTGAVVYANSPSIASPAFTSAFSATETAATQPVSLFGEAAGTSFMAASNIASTDTSSHAGKGHFAFFVGNTVTGTGTNGPTNADYSLGLSLFKAGAGTGSAQTGELDAGYIAVRNDSAPGNPNSDTTGLLFDIGNYGAGFNAGYEIHTSLLNSSGITSQIGLQSAVIDNRDGYSYGYVYNATVGAQTGALLTQNQGTGRWGFLQRFVDHNGTIKFDMPIDSNEVARIRMFDSSGNAKTMRVNANRLSFMNNAETAEIFTVDDSGNAQTGGNLTTGGVNASGASQFTLASGTGLAVTANATVGGTLTVTGAASAASLSLGTALPITQGGTGATSAATARSNLSAAQSGANTDITSLNAPALGAATATTQTSTDNSTKVATTAYVQSVLPIGYTAYTPTISASSGSYTSASATGGYMKDGKLVCIWAVATITTVGTGTTTVLGLPFATATTNGGMVIFPGRENAVNGKMLQGASAAGSSTMTITDYSNASAATNGASEVMSGCYISQ
ncbi:hypothetical protein ACSC95_06215 [Burkholderia vietnamiensis]